MSKRAKEVRSKKHIRSLCEARAILTIAALNTGKHAASYFKIADDLGLDTKIANIADEIWMDANEPGADWKPETEERAVERVNDLLRMSLDA